MVPSTNKMVLFGIKKILQEIRTISPMKDNDLESKAGCFCFILKNCFNESFLVVSSESSITVRAKSDPDWIRKLHDLII